MYDVVDENFILDWLAEFANQRETPAVDTSVLSFCMAHSYTLASENVYHVSKRGQWSMMFCHQFWVSVWHIVITLASETVYTTSPREDSDLLMFCHQFWVSVQDSDLLMFCHQFWVSVWHIHTLACEAVYYVAKRGQWSVMFCDQFWVSVWHITLASETVYSTSPREDSDLLMFCHQFWVSVEDSDLLMLCHQFRVSVWHITLASKTVYGKFLLMVSIIIIKLKIINK